MKDAEFDAAYRAAKWASFGQTIARLQHASGAAVSTMINIMIDGTTPPSIRLRAAEGIVQNAIRGTEQEQIEQRIAALEQLNINPPK